MADQMTPSRFACTVAYMRGIYPKPPLVPQTFKMRFYCDLRWHARMCLRAAFHHAERCR